AGIVRPMRGRVTCAGEDLARVSPTRRARLGIAHVPEGRGIFFGLTVAEHFRLARGSVPIDEEIAYKQFPLLRELRSRRAGLLSGGQHQMLPLGRAPPAQPR